MVIWCRPVASLTALATPKSVTKRVLAREHDVFGLDVAMHQAVLVRVGQRVGHVVQQPHHVADGELGFLLQPLAERLAFLVRHDVEEKSVGFAGVIERQDVRMVKLGGHLDFAHEAVGAEGRRQVRLQHLHRHLAVVLEVLGQVHRGHAADAEFAFDAVAVGQRRDKPGKGVGHCLTFALSSWNQFST